MAEENGRRFFGARFGKEKIARHDRARAVVKLKFLHDVIAAVFARERFDLGHFGPGRQLTEQFPELGANLFSFGFPSCESGRRLKRRRDVRLLQPFLGCGLICLAHKGVWRHQRRRDKRCHDQINLAIHISGANHPARRPLPRP